MQLNPLVSYQAPRLSQSYAHISQHGTTPIFELKNKWKTSLLVLVKIEQFIIGSIRELRVLTHSIGVKAKSRVANGLQNFPDTLLTYAAGHTINMKMA